MDIKPIETVYNGYRFRSRLEARWAVFFDAAGIEYQYEPEGFEHDGITYLPDFYLPKLDIYAEVKGNREGVDKEIEKCKKMIHCGGPIKQIVFLGEVPGDLKHGLWHFPAIEYACGGISKGWFFFFDDYVTDGTAGHISSADYPAWDDSDLSPKGANSLRVRETYFEGSEEQWDRWWNGADKSQNERTIKAFITARQARFEHGEKPSLVTNAETEKEQRIRVLKERIKQLEQVNNVRAEIVAKTNNEIKHMEAELQSLYW